MAMMMPMQGGPLGGSMGPPSMGPSSMGPSPMGPASGGCGPLGVAGMAALKPPQQAMLGGMDVKTLQDELVKQMTALATSLGDSPVAQMVLQQCTAMKTNPMMVQANIMGAGMMVQQFAMMCGGDAKAMQENFTKQAAVMMSSSPELQEVQETVVNQLKGMVTTYSSFAKPAPLPGLPFGGLDLAPKPAEVPSSSAGADGGGSGNNLQRAAAFQKIMGKKGRENRTTVFIGGLRKTTEEDRVHAHFAKYGEVEHVDIKRLPEGTSRGFAFVRFKDEESVERVIEAHAKHMIDNKWVEVRRRDSVAACAGRAATLAKEQEESQPPPQPTAPVPAEGQDSKAAAEDWSQQYLTAAHQMGMQQQAQMDMMKAYQAQQNNPQGMMMGMAPGMMSGMPMMMGMMPQSGAMMAPGGGMMMMGGMDPKAMGMDPSMMGAAGMNGMAQPALMNQERAQSASSRSASSSASRSRSPHAKMDRRSRSRDRREPGEHMHDQGALPPPMGMGMGMQPLPPPQAPGAFAGMQFNQSRPAMDLFDPNSEKKRAEAAAAASAVANMASRAAEAAKVAAKEAADRPAPVRVQMRSWDGSGAQDHQMPEFLPGGPGVAAVPERRGAFKLWLPEAAAQAPAPPQRARSSSRKKRAQSPSPNRKRRGGGWDKEMPQPGNSSAPVAPSRPALPPGTRPNAPPPPQAAVTYGVKSAGDRHTVATPETLHAAILRAQQVEAEGKRIMRDTGVIPRGPPDLPTGTEVIEQKYVAYLIGKGGQALAAINSAAGVHIHIDQSTKASGYCMANIYGNEEGTMKAKCILAQKISEYRPPRSH
mmetsp:Transcript_251/g.858  ORF Transcript_251/g.858 Transcript_251/m.858 type:complete len:815 (+) Transcript_251:84-2528(+)